jgi:glycosyltransferase involved in cell wall biosynthesis
MNHRVSLYIPCYNAERYLERTLEGALRQTYPLDEILVIDDGSRDRTREIASRYPVRVLSHDRNRGLPAARNTGFRSARNELVASLDADCVAEPDWLERLLPHLHDPKVVGHGRQPRGGGLDLAGRPLAQGASARGLGGSQSLPIPPFLFGANGLHRKSAMEEVAGHRRGHLEGDAAMTTSISTKLRQEGL